MPAAVAVQVVAVPGEERGSAVVPGEVAAAERPVEELHYAAAWVDRVAAGAAAEPAAGHAAAEHAERVAVVAEHGVGHVEQDVVVGVRRHAEEHVAGYAARGVGMRAGDGQEDGSRAPGAFVVSGPEPVPESGSAAGVAAAGVAAGEHVPCSVDLGEQHGAAGVVRAVEGAAGGAERAVVGTIVADYVA